MSYDHEQVYSVIGSKKEVLGFAEECGSDFWAVVRLSPRKYGIALGSGVNLIPSYEEIILRDNYGQEVKNPVGRPPVLADGKGGKRRGVYLDDETWRKATVLGDGKPSEGLRRAISACNDSSLQSELPNK